MAKKMTKDKDVDGAVEEAPSAIPSAQAWTTRPMVVADDLGGGAGCGSGGGEVFMPLRLTAEELCGPRLRLEREICNDWYFGFDGERASGRWSTRNMRMKPRVSDTPM